MSVMLLPCQQLCRLLDRVDLVGGAFRMDAPIALYICDDVQHLKRADALGPYALGFTDRACQQS